MVKKTIWIGIIVIILIAGGFFLFNPSESSKDTNNINSLSDNTDELSITESETDSSIDNGDEIDTTESESSNWRNIELSDVSTGETFKISDFDKPVLLEAFAVWCPTCKKQQDNVKNLHEEIGDAAVSISVDTDVNENEEQVLNHKNRHGYDWQFAIAPTDFTQSLIDEFGSRVVSAPSAPVIVIRSDGEAEFLHSGVKSSNELKAELGL